MTRYAGQDGLTGYVDGNAITEAKFNVPHGIIMAADGTMYVADRQFCDTSDLARRIYREHVGRQAASPKGRRCLCGDQCPCQPGNPRRHDPRSQRYAAFRLGPDGVVVGMNLMDDVSPYAIPSSAHVIAVTPTTVRLDQFVTGRGVSAGDLIIFNNIDRWSSPTPVFFAVAYIGFPEMIRFTSNGSIVILEGWNGTVRLIDLKSRTVSRVGAFGNVPVVVGVIWASLAVDTAGTCGPVDDIICFTSDTGSLGTRSLTWRLSLDGTYSSP
jgi:hypothetical protein